jgi:hypothetical protein
MPQQRPEQATLPAISVALPPSREIVEHARLAARLGYRRVIATTRPRCTATSGSRSLA